MSLTDTRIKQAKPRGKPYKLVDGEGLFLLVNPNGSKLWRRRLRVNGVETMYAIGRYGQHPDVGLAEAREQAREAFKLAKQGINPVTHRKASYARTAAGQAATFKAMAETWLAHKTKEWTSITLRQRKALLEDYIYPKLGDLPASDVRSPIVKTVLDAIHKAAPSQTGFARHIISGVMGEAIIAGLTDTDPVYVLRDRHKAPATQHSRPLDQKEIKPFFSALEKAPMQETTRIAIRLAFWSLCRSMEVVGARWTEFDLDNATWMIPAERMKKRQQHAVPLPSQAVVELKRLRAFIPHREHLFPNTRDPRRSASHTFLNKAVVGLGFKGFSPHGIRSTGSTMLHDMGFRSEIIERQLAHQERSKTARSYNRALYLDERRQMMQSFADFLDGLCAGAKVTAFKRASA
ncbi:MAG: tyrosine-type recombinase/integrase [Proteobacteria bacterium]|nr:tyrosine-type recombinase/integrase [Pseudomonadota bacterium]